MNSSTLNIPTSNLHSRNRTTVNFLFWMFLLTTLRMTAFFQFFIKKTYTGLLTNFFSFTPFRYKIDLIHTLIDRTNKINNTSSGFQNNLIKLSDTLKRNSFPSHIIEKTFKQYLNKPSDQKCRNVNDETIHAILSLLLSASTLE